MFRLIRELRCDQKGLTLIEYALLASMITIILIGTLQSMGVTLKSFFTTVNATLTTA